MKYNTVLAIEAEVDRARKMHPDWPPDIIHQAGIAGEEAGEMIKAAVDEVYKGDPREAVLRDALHTIAVGVRILEGL